jgi:hypothetical protein
MLLSGFNTQFAGAEKKPLLAPKQYLIGVQEESILGGNAVGREVHIRQEHPKVLICWFALPHAPSFLKPSLQARWEKAPRLTMTFSSLLCCRRNSGCLWSES